MATLLTERMTRTYGSLSETQALETDSSLVKTFLVEASTKEDAPPGAAYDLLMASLTRRSTYSGLEARVHRSQESGLVSVETTAQRDHVVAYVDFTNPRYWLLHSMSGSSALDSFIEQLTTAGPHLDRAWLPANFLEWVSEMGSFRGLGLDYDRRVIPDVDFEAPDAPVEFLKMQLWGNKARDILNTLRGDAFPHETTLSKVKIKFWHSESQGEFSLDDVKFDGKITARGTSFHSHNELVSAIYLAYSDHIRKIESQFSIGEVLDEKRLSLTGEPLHFFFDRPIADLKVFCDHVFSASEPFRIWGTPVAVDEYFYRVEALDLHVNCRLQFEATPDFLRLYLPAGSCGNSVMRLYTNLQHYYDSRVRLSTAEGSPILEF